MVSGCGRLTHHQVQRLDLSLTLKDILMLQYTCIMEMVIRNGLSTNPRLVSILVALMLLANGRDWVMAGVLAADMSSLFFVPQMLRLYRLAS